METEKANVWMELAKISKPRAPKKHTHGGPGAEFHGWWYVVCDSYDKNEYQFGTLYLQRDGRIIEGTQNEQGEYTGWYKTKDEAEEAIKHFYELNFGT